MMKLLITAAAAAVLALAMPVFATPPAGRPELLGLSA
jgi:hypothetical protein